MLLVAACGPCFLLMAPLAKLGAPPCLTPAQTATWLLRSPGSASCTECHRSFW